jgi:HlyD family secretion protein
MNHKSFISMALTAVLLAGCGKSDEGQLQGWVEAELIFISPDEQGRVEQLKVREGDKVAQGQLLFTVDDDLHKELARTQAGTQKSYDDAEAALRQANANLAWANTRVARRSAYSPAEGTIQQVYFRPGETVNAGKPVLALLPPQNLKFRFFAPQPILPQIKLGQMVNISCDGCPAGLTAKVSFIARSAEYTPPVIYSLEERSKLVFLIEARPEQPERLRVGQPISVTIASTDATKQALKEDPKNDSKSEPKNDLKSAPKEGPK